MKNVYGKKKTGNLTRALRSHIKLHFYKFLECKKKKKRNTCRRYKVIHATLIQENRPREESRPHLDHLPRLNVRVTKTTRYLVKATESVKRV